MLELERSPTTFGKRKVSPASRFSIEEQNLKALTGFSEEPVAAMAHYVSVGVEKITMHGALRDGVEKRCTNICQR